MTITIRPAGPGDRAAVGVMLGEFIDYLNAIEPQEVPTDAPPELIDSLLDQAFGPRPVCSTLIAEQVGAPVGYVSYHAGIWEVFRSIHVVSLFVRSTARGSGAGKALMKAVRDLARADGSQRVVWEVWDKNPTAIAFYERLGGEIYRENLRMSWTVE